MKVTLLGISTPINEPKDPEILSAAASYCSHDKNNLSTIELIEKSGKKLETTRSFNSKVIFGMGHSMPAEMVNIVFGFDGISRAAVEYLQHRPYYSCIERSQRYIKMNSKIDWVIPKELEKDKKFLTTYFNSKLEDYFKEIEKGVSLEDARKNLPLAMPTKMIFSCNVLELEHLVSGLREIGISELNEIANKIDNIMECYPSIYKYSSANPIYKFNIHNNVSNLYNKIVKNINYNTYTAITCDIELALNEEIAKIYTKLRKQYIDKIGFSTHFIDSPIYIYINAMKSYTFGQWKRHRLFKYTVSNYELPYALNILTDNLDLKTWLATNSSIREVLTQTDIRGLLNFMRLRNDEHAQLDIRTIAIKINNMIKKISKNKD